MSLKALEQHLEPLQPFLDCDELTEICINRPGEVFVEKAGRFTGHSVKSLEYPLLETLAALVAEYNSKDFPTPIVGGRLPGGERVQFALPPVSESGKVVCSIRRHRMQKMRLADYAVGSVGSIEQVNDDLVSLYEQGKYLVFVEAAVKSKKNILICGGTGTGKTTFLNACLACVPNHERLITVEDTREVQVDQPNVAHLLFNEEEKSLNALNVFKACLRLRPDRILLSELRSDEVWSFLRAANSGHPGSLSTIHADSPEAAFQQLVFMMQQAGSNSTEEQILDYVMSIIHVVVQLKRDPVKFVVIEDVWFG